LSPYVVITPVRKEQDCLPRTIESVTKQTVLPGIWVIVNDGSTDATSTIAEHAAAVPSWIRVVHCPDRGFRQPGTGVINAFYAGFEPIKDAEWAYDWLRPCQTRIRRARCLLRVGGAKPRNDDMVSTKLSWGTLV
jgi:cellulose synthase/poly-beta-1,6-N-acetylglucosamine synthase-like glycosyltransferase